MNELEVIYQDKDLKISKKSGDSDITFLCFSGVGMAFANVHKQQEEFNKATGNASAIFIVDYSTQWGNIDWERLYDIIKPHIHNRRVFSLGNSMGGYCAILASRYFVIEKVIAFVPQYSVHKSVVPFETRWSNIISKIKTWEHISLEGSFNDKTKYYLFYGDDPEDSVHRELFPKQENIYITVYDGNHFLVKGLRDSGKLYGLISDIVNKKQIEY